MNQGITADAFIGRALVYHALRHPPAGDWTQAVQRAFIAISAAKKDGRSAGWQIASGKRALHEKGQHE